MSGGAGRCPAAEGAAAAPFTRSGITNGASRKVLERRSPTGIARERETRPNDPTPRQSHACKPTHPQPRRITGTWSAGLRPASRGSAKLGLPPPAPANHASPTAQNHGDMERRSPTGIARERETRTNDAGHANLTATNPRIANRAESRGAWSAGLRPASRGSAKPAPTTPPPANLTAWSAGLRPAPLREAQRKPPKPKPRKARNRSAGLPPDRHRGRRPRNSRRQSPRGAAAPLTSRASVPDSGSPR